MQQGVAERAPILDLSALDKQTLKKKKIVARMSFKQQQAQFA